MSTRVLSLFALFMLVAFGGGLVLLNGARTHRISVAAGPVTGEAYEMASAIADVFEHHHPRVQIEVLETSGSAENLRLLAQGRVELAAVQADSRPGPEARVVAGLYPDLFQLVVREEAEILDVGDLRGRKIAIPPQESGQTRSFWELVGHYGLGPDDIEALSMSAPAADWALIDGAVDAVFRVRAAGNRSILALTEATAVRLVPIRHAAAIQLRQPAVEPGVIPVGAYRGSPAVPETDLPTVAVQRLLVAAAGVDDELVNRLTAVLFDRRRELVNLTPLAGFITPPEPGGGTFIPIHAGARRFYDRDAPSFLQQNAEPIALFVTMAALLASGLLQLGSRRKKRRIDQYNRAILQLGARARELVGASDLQRSRDELFEIAGHAVDDAEAGRISREGFEFFAFTWRVVDGLLRDREAELGAGQSRA